MKLFVKLGSLVSILALSTILLIGCSANEAQVYNSFIKSYQIKSMEAKSDITMHFSTEGIPEEQKASVSSVTQILNNMKLSINAKSKQSEDNKIAKAEYQGEVEVGGIGTKFGLWVDADLSTETPKIKEIMKLPAIFTASFPQQFAGKEYMVMDFSKMSKEISESGVDFKGLAKVSASANDFVNTKLVSFLDTYGKQFNSGLNIVTKKGSNQYEVRFDDATFKAFLRYLVNNADENKAIIKEIVKEYFNLIASSMKDKGEFDANTILAGFDSGMSEFKKSFNTGMDLLKNVKIVGDKGIVITYTLDNGYVVKAQGTIDLVFDIAKLDAISNPGSTDASNQGIIKITLDINSDISNINKDVEVLFPTLTSDNSFDYVDMMKYIEEENAKQAKAFKEQYYKNKAIDVMLNDRYVYFSTSPRVVKGTVMVPMRETFSAMGAKIQWNSKKQTVLAAKGNTKILIKVKSSSATVNGKTKKLAVPATVIDNKVFVPLRFVTESLGGSVRYDVATKTVYIKSK
ncbi:MAG: copper amine oxidase N-terminal domain-containing protein [Deltaproteobacteria bacterium]